MGVMVAATAGSPAQLRAQDRPFAIRAKAYIDPQGKTVEPAVLIVREGTIAAIGPDAPVPAECIVLERPDATICPGFIDVHVSLGAGRRTGEAADSVESKARAAELFNRHHHDFERAARAGVTTVLLAPSSRHLVGGTTAAVKTAGSIPDARILGPGPIKISLAAPAFNLSRTPTSIQGGLDRLRDMIAIARDDKDDHSAFARWARAETIALIDTGGPTELNILAGFAAEQKVRCVALGAAYAAERLADVKMLAGPVVLGPIGLGDPMRFTRTPAILARESVPFALTSAAPTRGPEFLRIAAAVAVAEGLSAPHGFAALTTTPASIAGHADRIGSLEPGKDADFVLYSGSPLDLSSRLLEVFIAGERVYRSSTEADGRGRTN